MPRHPEYKSDPSHNELIEDLRDLLEEAETFQFHDFKNSKYDMPKSELMNRLQTLLTKTKQGEYDN